MKTPRAIARIALAAVVVLTCAALRADPKDYVRCHKVECTETCDFSAPPTGQMGMCRDISDHLVSVTSIACCCCTGYKHAKDLKWFPIEP